MVWTDNEVELIVRDYFSMLTDELNGQKYIKAHHRKALVPQLNHRSEASVEFKYQNISAVLVGMGLPFINGYLPRYNFQRDKLTLAIQYFLLANPQIESLFSSFAEEPAKISSNVHFDKWLVQAPDLKIPKEFLIAKNPTKINYLRREEQNHSLGLKGEELAMEYERYCLINAGKSSFADKIEWVSKDKGDGLGYDILSRNHNGTDKYIEVKTTRLGREAPFYFSSNEYRFSLENKENYHLYRIFNFNSSPKIFMLGGSFDSFCRIEPIQYRGCF